MSDAHPLTAKPLLALLRAIPHVLKHSWGDTEPLVEPAPADVDIDLDRLAAELPQVEWIRLELDADDEWGWTTQPSVAHPK